MKLRKSLVALGVVVFASAANAKVASMSGEQSFVDANGVSSAKVTVKCSASKEAKTIIRSGEGAQWCDSVLVDLCHRHKLRAAKNVCGFNYKRLLSEQGSGGSKVAKAEPKPAVQSAVKAEPVAKIKRKPVVREPVVKPKVPASNKATAAFQNELAEIEKEQALIQKRQAELRSLELELQKQKAATGL